jgi:pimeloyl-ACP methyl ester carboxylesterase
VEHSFVWQHQIEEIDANIPLIAIDLPSHGKSSKFEDLSLDLYVDSIKKLKKELDMEKLILCGHSLGGAIAQTYYFKYPEDEIGLILMSTGAKLRVLDEILENTKNNFNQYLTNIPVGAFYRKTSKKFIDPYVKEISKIEPMVLHTDFQICNNFDILDEISSIDVPCLIIVGKADVLTPVKYHKYFHKHIRDSELHIINNAGHAVMIEKSIQVNKTIEKFLQRFD